MYFQQHMKQAWILREELLISVIFSYAPCITLPADVAVDLLPSSQDVSFLSSTLVIFSVNSLKYFYIEALDLLKGTPFQGKYLFYDGRV